MENGSNSTWTLERTEVFVEIFRKSSSHQIDKEHVHRLAYEYLVDLAQLKPHLKCETMPACEHIEEITISNVSVFPIDFDKITFFVHSVSEHSGEVETLENGSDGIDEVPASYHWILPNRDFQGQWEYLIYEKDLKENILRFAKTIMLFSQKNIDSNVISCNKLVLLHGPPGTGKTSLCKALAQKLSIHMNNRFRYTHLFEVNSHSLFSKWFSESGKLVLKLFSNIKEVAEDPQSLVIILIDEVESIAYARDSVSANEPSDSLRVVNAVLTQLDQLRKHFNVLVLTTSNLSGTIDLAFVDRADLKQYIGEPSVEAIYDIYKSAIDELFRVGIIRENDHMADVMQSTVPLEWNAINSKCLREIAAKSYGLSGRTLRKLPLLAHAWFIHVDYVSLHSYLMALTNAVNKHLFDAKAIQKKS